ncbi:MAG: aminomethyl-transferring glycine dehydrogenase subunit GcvPA [Lachnospiraceae bacterium]|nr:aminomethyl-transferring glycine dehydrogenase subunit GcvPA [Lachnospiraceae bacterium]
MGSYLSVNDADRKIMLDRLGVSSVMDLYRDVPQDLILDKPLDLPDGKAEMQVGRIMKELAAENRVYGTVFRGAGAYRHYIPAIVDQVAAKETFLTAYTPYQAEISQGVLQSIFEYQTMICELTGMDVSNASVYDGATAAAEAAAMCRDRKRRTVIVSETVNPEVLAVMKTYSWASDNEIVTVPEKDGVTDMDELLAAVGDGTAAVYIQSPNYFGCIEDLEAAAGIAHAKNAKLIAGVDPIAQAILKTPYECGADIAVGEGQPLGLPLSYGGPYLGFMACTKDMMRKLPGRIVGQTADAKGNTAYVLTLQAREQHIRREKASSNICSNEALCALRAAVYMAAMGREGIREAARQCVSKAHYLQEKLAEAGFERKYGSEFFHEFVTACPQDPEAVMKVLSDNGILGGLVLEGKDILWCATEMNTKEEIDRTAALLKEAF